MLRETLTDLANRVPKVFDLISLSDRAASRIAGTDGPYLVVLIQECTRLNSLLTEIAYTLDELQKGLNGQLNMSQGMEDMAECLEINQVQPVVVSIQYASRLYMTLAIYLNVVCHQQHC